jgi:hypothetical protein
MRAGNFGIRLRHLEHQLQSELPLPGIIGVLDLAEIASAEVRADAASV